jgi:predicted nucleotidyltransferase
MKLKSELKYDLNKLVPAITSVEGVVAIILFGSRARGDYDEYSDYDLLVIFENDELMWKNRRQLYQNIGNLGLFTQVLTRSIKELTEKTEPTFLQNILQHGILLYLRYPFKAPALAQNLKPATIVSYHLRKLPHNQKMKINYRLFGKQNKKNLVEESGGRKLGDGCFMISTESLQKATSILKQFNVPFDTIRVYTQPMTTTEPQTTTEQQTS